jgi:hypothetical protein
MGTPTAAFQTYAAVGIREDLEDVIYDISPMDTWFFTKASRMRATNTLHDWQTDALAAPNGDNAYVEGDDFSAQAVTATTKYRNYTQIARKEIVVSRTMNKVNTAGRKEELAYQIVKKGKELKRDIETACIQNKAATSGGASSARVAASVESWIFSANHVKASTQTTSSTTAPVNGIQSTVGVDGTVVAFNEGDLKNCLQQAWSCGGETDTILLGAVLKNKLDAFSGIATRFRNVAAGQQADIVAAADVYVSSYGSHKVVLSRYMRATVVLCLDSSTWGIAWLDPIQSMSMPKSGDSERHMLVCEYTVVAKSPTANTKLTGVN